MKTGLTFYESYQDANYPCPDGIGVAFVGAGLADAGKLVGFVASERLGVWIVFGGRRPGGIRAGLGRRVHLAG